MYTLFKEVLVHWIKVLFMSWRKPRTFLRRDLGVIIAVIYPAHAGKL